jgi:hypothetical protein
MFHIDKNGAAAGALGLSDQGQTKGGLSRGFGTINFTDPSAGQSADAKGEVDGRTAGGNDVNIDFRRFAKAHDSAVAELFIDGGKGEIEGLFPVGRTA